eukprot:SAG31_NODE_7258_length_1740_cov_2.535040_2_plen_96_part_00
METWRKAKANVTAAMSRSGGNGEIYTTEEPAVQALVSNHAISVRNGAGDSSDDFGSWSEARAKGEIKCLAQAQQGAVIYSGSTNIRVRSQCFFSW